MRSDYKETILKNPGIDPYKWTRDEHKYESLSSVFLLAGTLVGIGVLVVVAKFVPLESVPEWVVGVGSMLTLVLGIVGGAHFGGKAIERLNESYKEKNVEYRRKHIPAIREAFESAGYPFESEREIEWLEQSDRPSVVDNAGERYHAQMNVWKEEIYVLLRLEAKDKKELKKDIPDLLRDYIEENGVLSEREKKVFLDAMKLGVDHAYAYPRA